jgi:hypothetical protein
LEYLTANAKVATVVGSITVSSDSGKSEPAADEAVLKRKVDYDVRKYNKNSQKRMVKHTGV